MPRMFNLVSTKKRASAVCTRSPLMSDIVRIAALDSPPKVTQTSAVHSICSFYSMKSVTRRHPYMSSPAMVTTCVFVPPVATRFDGDSVVDEVCLVSQLDWRCCVVVVARSTSL